jgi:carbonic anhydrase/acetyltransferase-like protein (isoleucine patch superfamily)
MHPVILPFKGVWPKIDASAYVAPGVVITGDVVIGPETNIWPGCVLRGDVNIIRIGARTNVQDGTVIHVSAGGQGTHIGDEVTIGHMVLLHDCTLESRCFVGMRSSVIDRARVCEGAMTGAGALVTQDKVVPGGQLWVGSPAKYMRDLKPEEGAEIIARAAHYVRLGQTYLQESKALSG